MEELKALAMGGQSGEAWAKRYDHPPADFNSRFGALSWAEAYPLVPELDRLLSSLGAPADVVQVGASSGTEIAWLASRHPLHIFVGTDIYEDVVSYENREHSGPNLSFEICSAQNVAEFIRDMRSDRGVILFFSGVLQYVHPKHVSGMFESLAEIPRLHLVLLEPASEANGSPNELAGSLPRTRFSYTHNYARYAESSGLITEVCKIIRPYIPADDYSDHKDTVRYFYKGRTST